ncbi:T9SS type A sorting domain-containing protein [Gelidibacter pelagius]|uniref:T9SS type A sorting domain-containing protein n=1 Tax=Gelidibacter pelagius TaxID=2819985 RepID=A0ABS3SMZ3_9FLAO|nr:T9SS type A sorting domain-containing protein [Gelidibacter pelagius]MBO3097083.1 T9SS type A sorting domain-containing protein [Gelidibacter pelagius]
MKKNLLIILCVFICSASFGQITELVTGMTDPGRMILSSTYLYYTDDDSVYRLDITVPNAVPELLASGLGNPNGVALNIETLYIAEFDAYQISTLELTSGNFEVARFATSNKPNFLHWHGSSLYVSSNTSTSRYVARFDDPATSTSGTLLAAIAAPSTTFIPFGIAVYNDRTLYIANAGTNSIDVIDPSTKDITPELFLSGFEKPLGIRIYKNILYIAENDGGTISAIDLTSANPTRIEISSSINDPIDIEVNDMGVFIMQENPNRIILIKNTLGLNEFETTALTVHPNPSSDYLNMGQISNTTEFIIYDSLGQMVKKGLVEPHTNSKIRIKDLTSGIYFLHLKNNTPIKFVKK